MKLCVSTVVDQLYQHFIPLFIFCLKKAYPEYHIKIFTHGKLSREVKSDRTSLGSGNEELVEPTVP